MNLYLIRRDGPTGWDEYEGAVVVAKDKAEACRIHPGGFSRFEDNDDILMSGWVPIEEINVTYIGKASPDLKPGEIILSSFHAG